MKTRITLFVILLITGYCNAQSDSLYRVQQQRIETLVKENLSLRSDVSALKRKIELLQSQVSSLSVEIGEKIDEQQTAIDGISTEVGANTESIAKTDKRTTGIEQKLKCDTISSIIIVIAILLILALVYFFLRKRIGKRDLAIDEIEQVQKRLQEESLKLDNKLVDILERQIKMESGKVSCESSVPNHTFALKVADEIVRIENNIKRMENDIRQAPSIKRLIQAIGRLKNSFLSNGYEVIDLIGKEYNEGMQVKATFITDEALPEGKQIISGVNKLQVNYNGVMIQAADVVISQNI